MSTHPQIKAVRPIRAKRMRGSPTMMDAASVTLYDEEVHGEIGQRYGVIDQSDEAQAALVEQVAEAISVVRNDPRANTWTNHAYAEAALSSLGLLTPARRRKL